MAVWVIRGGRYGEREDEALENNVLTIGFGYTENFDDAQTQEDIAKEIQRHNPDATPSQITGWSRQIWSFKSRIENGNLVVMPRKGQPYIAIGTIAGNYMFRPELQELQHGRPVEWINTEVSRNSLSEDLKRSLSADMTIFQPRAPDSENRLKAIAADDKTPFGGNSYPVILPGESEEADTSFNIEEEANNRIREYIGTHFHGHGFTRLVAAVLEAQGYVVEVAPPGPDGGVDIVAGSGPMGFDRPRICVQVKSGAQTTKVNVLRELEGIIKNFGADFGLLVSWGGFTGDTKSEARKSAYFNVRLWDSESFLTAVFQNYEQLPAVLKAELPMKQIWTMDDPSP